MGMRVLVLLLLVILPGVVSASVSAYFLFPDWAALTASVKRYSQLAASPTSTPQDLAIAQAAETRHRLNCFAEGVGVLLGWTIVAVGIHGLCTLPRRSS